MRNVPKDKLKQLGITKKSLKQDFNLNKIKDIFDKNGIKFLVSVNITYTIYEEPNNIKNDF